MHFKDLKKQTSDILITTEYIIRRKCVSEPKGKQYPKVHDGENVKHERWKILAELYRVYTRNVNHYTITALAAAGRIPYGGQTYVCHKFVLSNFIQTVNFL
jgi:transcriptional regulator of NAD metabolism